MRKLILSFSVVICLLFVYAGTGHAEAAIRLYLDTKQLKPEVPPKIVNGTTLVPVRIISEELGAKVSWSSTDKKVTVEKNALKIQLQISNTEVTVNGAAQKLEAAPLLVDGNTLLPVRFISEQMGLKVVWDDLTRSVSLYDKDEAVPTEARPDNEIKPETVPAGALPSPKPTASPVPKPTSTPKPSPIPSSSASSGTDNQAIAEVQQIAVEGDVLKIKASGRGLRPKFTTLSSPHRLVIDLPNAAPGKTVNGRTAVQNSEFTVDHPYISKIRYALYQDAPSTVRIVVDLKQKIDYNLLESKNPGELAISLKAIKYRIVLDPGHGGTDPGASSARGRKEKDFTLPMVLKIAKHLESVPDLNVRLTRDSDTYPELNERTALANDSGADLFVSIHANKFSKSSVQGTETYYTRENSQALAKVLHNSILTASGSVDRGVKTEDFRVTKYTVMPAVLCEIGYLSNPEEEQKLFDEAFQERVAASIADGIKQYLQIP